MLEEFHIYVINLSSRKDRRQEMALQLKRAGLAFDSPNVTLFAAVRPDDAGPFPSIGCRGCFLSHLGVLEDAERRGHQQILVFEDDLDFSKDFATQWPQVQARLREETWSIFYGGHPIDDGAPVPRTDSLTLYPSSAGIQGAHFVGFHENAIGLLVAHLKEILARPAGDPQGGPMHVDGAYCWFRQTHSKLQTWIATPPLGHQRSSRTDIHELRWYDRAPLVRNGVALARRVRGRLLG